MVRGLPKLREKGWKWLLEEKREAAVVEARRLHELGGLLAKKCEPAEVASESQAFDVYTDEEAEPAEDDFAEEVGSAVVEEPPVPTATPGTSETSARERLCWLPVAHGQQPPS